MMSLTSFKEIGATLLIIITIVSSGTAATQIDIFGPTGSGSFGANVVVLPNGNLVVADSAYDITSPMIRVDVCAVHLYKGSTGALISTLTGGLSLDNVGHGGITVLANGDFVVASPNWSIDLGNGARISSVGAATYCRADIGCSGIISSANSLIGSTADDHVGSSVIALPNGNFIVD